MENIEEIESVNGQPEVLQEGKAKILIDKKNIFYNPVQEFNRDLSVAVLTQFSKDWTDKMNNDPKIVEKRGLRVLEALSATGLRSIRYAKEVPGIDEIVANDISVSAVEAIKKNVVFNQVDSIVKPHANDATMVMYENRRNKFDVIDLDPYGCPSIFLDGAVQSIKDNGLLLVTATDMAVLAGNSPETCYVKYGAVSLKSKSCHEMALRILLQHIASHAGRYGKVITPLLSVSADFYIRVFVKIHTSQKSCKQNTSNLGMVYQYKHCEFCKYKHQMGGPLWTGKLHDKDFIHKILKNIESEEENNIQSLGTIRRIHGMLYVIEEELEVPLYYQLDQLTSTIRGNVPPMTTFRSAIFNAGYQISYSHANKYSIKTNAPNTVIWDIIRAWEKDNPVKREKFVKNSPGLAILETETKINVSFEKHPNAVPQSQQKKMTRFQLNPSAYWGPGTKSTTIRNQNKNKRKRERNAKNDESMEEKKPNTSVE
ncbi:unnamed protein product [Trichogramma brassicae]|uniref:tRNA (guanine(26)-N(2))-dimethyltransferase n=1 Tax=Trichogramma brassicae TaxID=86971 RepID=A0A6H5ILF1_9HYME|nr:unnamed protein product [Trichogramma brassicae]